MGGFLTKKLNKSALFQEIQFFTSEKIFNYHEINAFVHEYHMDVHPVSIIISSDFNFKVIILKYVTLSSKSQLCIETAKREN